jgi:hypothetical protein
MKVGQGGRRTFDDHRCWRGCLFRLWRFRQN